MQLQKNISTEKNLYAFGYFIYLFLIFLSVLFYKERIISSDGAFYAYKMLRTGAPAIMHNRFTGIFTQVLPCIAIYLRCPLHIVLICFSINFILFPVCIYAITGSLMNSKKTAIAYLLFQMLFVSHTFYWTVSELPTGVAFLMLLLACFENKETQRMSWQDWLIAACLLIPTLLSHPLLLFVVPFAFLFLWHTQKISFKALYSVAALCAGILVLKLIFLREPYEQGAASGLKYLLLLYPDYLDTYSGKRFLSELFPLYQCLLVAVTAIICYYRKKDLTVAIITTVAIAGYIVFINLCNPEVKTQQSYRENLYLPVAFFAAYPLAQLIHIGKYRLVIFAILVTGCVRIFFCHKPHTARLQWERSVLATQQKCILKETEVPHGFETYKWGIAFEALLLSQLEDSGKGAMLVHEEGKKMEDYCLSDPNVFIHSWGCDAYKEMPATYFRFKDTVSTYSWYNKGAE